MEMEAQERFTSDPAAVAPGQAPGRAASAADLAVLEALRRGDETAFTRLVEQHHATLRRIALLFVSSAAVADEVVQDTWLGVVEGVWAFEGRSSLKTWILRILVNRAKTRAVREGRMAPFADLGHGDLEPPVEDGARLGARRRVHPSSGDAEAAQEGSCARDPGPSPEGSLLAGEAREQLRTAIDALPVNLRTVLTMRDVEGCSSEEVCNVLGISETNQRVILHRARSRVREALRHYLGGE